MLRRYRGVIEQHFRALGAAQGGHSLNVESYSFRDGGPLLTRYCNELGPWLLVFLT